MYCATPATTTAPAAKRPLNPVGSAPDLLVALAIAEEAPASTEEMALEIAEGPRDAAEEDALNMALEADEEMDATTEETEIATD
jgi:hypothetical protein